MKFLIFHKIKILKISFENNILEIRNFYIIIIKKLK